MHAYHTEASPSRPRWPVLAGFLKGCNRGPSYSISIIQGKTCVDHLQEHYFHDGFALCLPILLISLLAWVKVTFLFPPVVKVTSRMIKNRIKWEVERSRRCYLLSITEHGWRPESSLQSSEENKDVSGTYAASSSPPRLEPSILRECQSEEFGIQNGSGIETVLAELKCYISTE